MELEIRFPVVSPLTTLTGADSRGLLYEGRLGLLSNGKPNARVFLESIGQELQSRGVATDVVLHEKISAGSGATNPQLESLRSAAFAITAFAD